MWAEAYFAPRYFGKEYFGPIISDDVTITQATYWSPQYFGAKYFSTKYFGRGVRYLPQVHEIEASDSFGVITDSAVRLLVHLVSAGDQLNVVLDETVPLFSGQGFSVSDTLSLEVGEFVSIDKDGELFDDLSINVTESASIGVVSYIDTTDVIILMLDDVAEREVRAYYVDRPTKTAPVDFYKDRDK